MAGASGQTADLPGPGTVASRRVAAGVDAQHLGVLAADLAVGVLLLLSGIVLWRRERAAGTLLVAASATWLLGFLWPAALSGTADRSSTCCSRFPAGVRAPRRRSL